MYIFQNILGRSNKKYNVLLEFTSNVIIIVNGDIKVCYPLTIDRLYWEMHVQLLNHGLS